MPRVGRVLKLKFYLVALIGVIGAMIYCGSRIPSGLLGSASREGWLAYGRGDWSVASEAARRALKLAPNDPEAIRLLARASEHLGRHPLAVGLYRRLGPPAMHAEDYQLLGQGFHGEGRESLALSSWLNAERLDPGHPDTLVSLSEHYRQARRPLEALARAEKLVAKLGWQARGSWLKGRLLADIGCPEQSVDSLWEVLADDVPSTANIDQRQVRLLLARQELLLGRPREARKSLEPLLSRTLGHDVAWLLSRALLQEGKQGQAVQVLSQAGGSDSDDPLRKEFAPWVGPRSCQPCHPSNYRDQQQSRHARTFDHEINFMKERSDVVRVVDPVDTDVTHELSGTGALILSTRVRGHEFRGLVRYLLGSGNHGQTFIARDEQGGDRESRISYYPSDRTWGLTIDHPRSVQEPIDYLGRPVTPDSLRSCLECHTTTSAAILQPAQSRPPDRGIGCERCHGPGGNHLHAISLKFPDLAIARPAAATAKQVTGLCAECHRAPLEGSSPHSPAYIRFQGPTFVRSRCYSESDVLSCVTCHNPHRDASHDPRSYERKCLECHPSVKSGEGSSRTRRPCPVNPCGDCLGCHMPKVADAVPRSVFTDHHIRIRKKEQQ